MLKILEQISSVTKFVNPFWEYKVDNYKMPSGNIGEYHYVFTGGATIVIPEINEKKYVMVNQYRYLNRRTSIEFPGGGIKKGNRPVENASQELIEETGYKETSMKLLGEFNPYNGVTNEICYVYLANGLTKLIPKPDESEEFEIFELSEQEVNDKIKNGEIWDGMSLAAWSIFLMKK